MLQNNTKHYNMLPLILFLFLNPYPAGIKDSSDEVISNSVFGMGVLVESSGTTLAPKYSEILGVLSHFLKEDGTSLF